MKNTDIFSFFVKVENREFNIPISFVSVAILSSYFKKSLRSILTAYEAEFISFQKI